MRIHGVFEYLVDADLVFEYLVDADLGSSISSAPPLPQRRTTIAWWQVQIPHHSYLPQLYVVIVAKKNR